MNILHIDNQGSVAHTLTREMKKAGHNVVLIGIYNPRESKCDVEIKPEGDMADPWVRRKAVFEEFKEIRKRINDFEIVHIHGGVGTAGLYYKLKKHLNRKKVVIHFHGTDIRENTNTAHYDVADLILVSTPDLLKFSKNVGGRELIHLPNPLNLSKIKPVDIEKREPLTEKDEIIITHLPSARGIKGTEYVIKAVKKLSKNYPVKLDLIENVERKKALKRMSESDVVIDWISEKFDIYGMVTIEAMAYGIPTICKFNPNYYSPPIINANSKTIEKKLEELITDVKLYKRSSIEGIKYVWKIHDSKHVAEKVIQLYQKI